MNESMIEFESQKYLVKRQVLVVVLYVVLVFAIFNDILRIPYTGITFYRALIPGCIGLILLYKKYAKQFLSLILILSVVSLFQQIIFYKVGRPDLTFSPITNLNIYIWYVLVIIVFFIVKCIKDNKSIQFEENMYNFIIYMGFAIMAVTLIDRLDTIFFNSSFFGALEVDNENNYGCSIAAVFPFFLAEFHKRKRIRDIIGIVLSFLIIYINDSKAVLFGMFLAFVVYLCTYKAAQNWKQMFLYRYLIIISGIFLIICLIAINPTIHGYDLRGTIGEPIIRILSNDPYPSYTSSVSYRTNTTLFCLMQLFKSGFLGIGIGNTGVLLKNEFPDLNPEYVLARSSNTISLHNSWLEFALDLGIIALIIYFFIIRYALRIFFMKKKISTIEMVRVIFIISFPIWSISASGIYTIYFIFIVIAYLLFANPERELWERRR